jgi:adenine/guanine phosphoribosyltransferase-like PRPP-binding protein
MHTASKNRAASKRTRRKNMNHYQISSPRRVFAIAAVAMTAITIGLSVVVPAKVQSDARDPRAVAAAKAMTPAPAEVVASRLHVEVVGVREPELLSVHVRSAPPKRKQDS